MFCSFSSAWSLVPKRRCDQPILYQKGTRTDEHPTMCMTQHTIQTTLHYHCQVHYASQCALCKLPCTIPNAVHYTGYRALHKLPHIKQGTVHGTSNSFPDKLSYMWLDTIIYTSYHALQQVLCTIQERIQIANYCAIYKRLQATIYSCKLQHVHITIYNKIVAIYNNVLQGTRVGACNLLE